MKKTIVLTLLLCLCITSVSAQNYSVKSVSYRQSDLKARTEQRMDANGKPCAIVRVGIVGIKDLTFPDAVGDVKYSLGEYVVYVSEGLQKFNYTNANGKVSGSITFDDYGLEVETQKVYSVTFESENHMRAAVFSVQPDSAKLTFNNEVVPLDKEGMAIIEKPIGEYSYTVEAKGYISQSGTVRLTEDEITTTTTSVLEQIQYPFTISCSPENASLFIDNIPYGAANQAYDLKLPDGQHVIRLTAEGYNEHEQTVEIDGKGTMLHVNMQKMRERVVEHKYERTRTHVNIRPAFYIHGGGQLYDRKQYLGHDWGLKLQLGAMQHFGGAFALYEGIGGGISNPTKNGKNDYFEHAADSANTYFVEIPILAGISVPFGKYNQNLISLLGGVYGKGMLTEIVKEDSDKAPDKHGNGYKTNWDFGLRGMIVLDISRFSIAAEVGYSLAKFYKIDRTTTTPTKSKESNKPSLFFGLSVGVKLGKL